MIAYCFVPQKSFLDEYASKVKFYKHNFEKGRRMRFSAPVLINRIDTNVIMLDKRIW